MSAPKVCRCGTLIAPPRSKFCSDRCAYEEKTAPPPTHCGWGPCGKPIPEARRRYRALYCARECAVKAAHKRANDRHDEAFPDRPRRATMAARMEAARGPDPSCDLCGCAVGNWQTAWLVPFDEAGPKEPGNMSVFCPECGRLERLHRAMSKPAYREHPAWAPIVARIAETVRAWQFEVWSARGTEPASSPRPVSGEQSSPDTAMASDPVTEAVSVDDLSDTNGEVSR